MEQLKEISSIQNCQMCLLKRFKCSVTQQLLGKYNEYLYVQLLLILYGMMYGRVVYILTDSITVSCVLFHNFPVISQWNYWKRPITTFHKMNRQGKSVMSSCLMASIET